MNANNKPTPERRPYVKPNIRTVELATKDVLAVGCKNSSGVSVNAAFPPCWASGCQSNGS